MTAATFVGQSSAFGTGSSVSVPAPAGLASGDHQLLIVLVGTSGAIPATPSGFASAGSFSGSAGDSSMSIAVFTDSASTVTGAISITNPASARLITAVRLAWRGGDGWLATPAPSGTTRTSASSHALPTQATTAADQTVVGAIAYDSGDGTSINTTWTPPAGWTERAEVNHGEGFETASIGAFDIVRTASGTQSGTVGASRSDVPFVWAGTLAAAAAGGSAPTVDAGADATVSVGEAFARTASENDNGSAVTARGWEIISGPADVGASNTTQGVSYTPTVAGTFVFRYSATNAFGTSTDDLTLTATAVVLDPVDIIPFGNADGQVHYKFDIAEQGQTRVLYAVADLAAGLNLDPEFTTSGNWVQTSARADGDTTSGTGFPRSEGREAVPGTGDNLGFDPKDGGVHWQRFRCRIMDHPLVDDRGIATGQLHSLDDDIVMVRTRYDAASGENRLVLRAYDATAANTVDVLTLVQNYAFGTIFDLLFLIRGDTFYVFFNDFTNPVYERPVADFPSLTTYMLKWGAYLQFNETHTDPADEGIVHYRNVLHWHTGWAAPTNYPGLPETDPGAAATATVGVAFERTATETGASITNRSWRVVDGPAEVGDQIGTAAALSWTPAVAGDYLLVYGAQNAEGWSTPQFLTVTASSGSSGGGTDTFGDEVESASASASSATKVAVSRHAPSSNGVVKTGHARLSITAGSTPTRFAIYADNAGVPGARLALSDLVTLDSTTATWLTYNFPVSDQIEVTAGTFYWIGPAWDGATAESISVYREGTSNGRYEHEDFVWPTPAADFMSGANARPLAGPIDAYVTYQSASLPTVGAGADATIDQYDEFVRTATEDAGGGTISARSWTVVSGPNQVGATIGTAATLNWAPTVGGSYVLRYSATNEVGTDTDDVTVTVNSMVFPLTATLFLAATPGGEKHASGTLVAPLAVSADPDGQKQASATPVASLALGASVEGKKINAVYANLALSASIEASSGQGAFVTAALKLGASVGNRSSTRDGAAPTAALALSADQEGEKAGAASLTAPVGLAVTFEGNKDVPAALTAPLALAAEQEGAKTGIGALAAELVLGAQLIDPSRTNPDNPLLAAMELDGGAATTSTRNHQNLPPARLGLRAVVFVQRIVAEIEAIQPRADTTVKYDLIAVARVPQQSGPPTFIEVDPIEWSDLTWNEELSAPPTLSATTKIDSLPDSILQRLQTPHDWPTELWLYRNGRKVFAGPLIGGRVSNDSLTLEAAGIEVYTRWMYIVENRTFTDVDQFAIVAELIDQWQQLDYGNFGIELTTLLERVPTTIGQAAYRSSTGDVEYSDDNCKAARPSGTSAGDLLIAVHAADDDCSLSDMHAPDGWDLLGEHDGGFSDTPRVKIWSRIAEESEPSSYEFDDSEDAHSALVILRVADHDPATPPVLAFASSSTQSNQHVAPSVTGVPGGLLMTFHAGETGGSTRSYWGAPSGMVSRADLAPSDDGYIVLGANTQELPSSWVGATGTKTATCSGSAEWVAASLVIAPKQPEEPPPIISGPVSGVLRTITYPQAEMHVVFDRITDLAKLADGLDWHIDPTTRRLEMHHPARGVDRSQGEDAIVFDQRNIISSDVAFSSSPSDLASDGMAVATASGSDAPLIANYGNPELRAKYGRTGITASFQAADQATLNAAAQALVDARDQVLLIPGPGARVTADSDLSAYDVGDTVSYHAHGRLTVAGAYRIRKRSVRVGENNIETVSIEFV